jgi:hypothetical protein
MLERRLWKKNRFCLQLLVKKFSMISFETSIYSSATHKHDKYIMVQVQSRSETTKLPTTLEDLKEACLTFVRQRLRTVHAPYRTGTCTVRTTAEGIEYAATFPPDPDHHSRLLFDRPPSVRAFVIPALTVRFFYV